MEWISVKDRTPNRDQSVLAYSKKTGDIFLVIYEFNPHSGDYFWSIVSSGCGCCDKDMDYVSHWMPLPEAPKDAE